MGSKLDKMNDDLMEYAPLDKDIIENLYFIQDAFRYMDLISLACESIVRPNLEITGRVSLLEDLGMILKSSGKKLGRTGTFAKILIAIGDLEILLGKMENMWTHDIDTLLVKPIQKCICNDSDELSIKRDQILNMRKKLRDAKIGNQPNVEALEKEYNLLQMEFKERLLQERKIITEFRRNLTNVLEKQLETTQNSAIHIEALVDQLKKNPKKIQISRDSSSDSAEVEGGVHKPITLNLNALSSTSSFNNDVLPDLTRHRTTNKLIFEKYSASKVSQLQPLKPMNPNL